MKILNFIYSNLEAILSGQSVDYSTLSYDEQHELFQVSSAHQIHMLVYETFKKSNRNSLDKSILDSWKANYIHKSFKNQRRTVLLSHIIKILQEENIRFVVLKGVSFSRYYNKQTSRIMGDLDILVDAKDLDHAVEVVLSEGYTKPHTEKGTGNHVVLVKKNEYTIEIHKNVVSEKLYPNLVGLTDDLLEQTTTMQFKDNDILIPKQEFEILYCLCHMYKHMIGAGFGFRQLIDLYNLLNSKALNWYLLFEQFEKYKILNFAKAMLFILQEIGGISYPEMIKSQLVAVDLKSVELLKKDIFLSGDFGRANKEKYVSAHLADYSKSSEKSMFVNAINFLFPSRKHMLNRIEFSYLKKNKLLTPYAWFHRLSLHFKNGDLSFKENRINKELFNDRKQLIRWVEEQ